MRATEGSMEQVGVRVREVHGVHGSDTMQHYDICP